jgi:hypothetical protein
MNLMKRSFIIITALAFTVMGFAQVNSNDIPEDVSKVATTAAQFLKLEVGPRATAMGGATVAAVEDMTALFWNPAGLAKVKQQSFYGTYTSLYAGIQHGYVAFGMPIGRSDYFGARHLPELRQDGSDLTGIPGRDR